MRNFPLHIPVLKVLHQLTRILLCILLVLLRGGKGSGWEQGLGATPVIVKGRQVDFYVEWDIVNELERSTSGVVGFVAPNLKVMNNLKKNIENVF